MLWSLHWCAGVVVVIVSYVCVVLACFVVVCVPRLLLYIHVCMYVSVFVAACWFV